MRTLLFLLLSTALALAEPKLLPVDESSKDQSFAQFRKALTAAVEKRDAPFIEGILAPDALASFGEERKSEGFERTYAFTDPNAPFWRELASVLSLGGVFSRGGTEFTAPYLTACWPEKYDAMEYIALIEKEVIVRATASPEAKEVARLSYSILKLASENESPGDEGWVAVQLPAGGIGFVPAASMRSPLNYRAHFRREGAKWKLASFLAGD